jgi:hypothetical protein
VSFKNGFACKSLEVFDRLLHQHHRDGRCAA